LDSRRDTFNGQYDGTSNDGRQPAGQREQQHTLVVA